MTKIMTKKITMKMSIFKKSIIIVILQECIDTFFNRVIYNIILPNYGAEVIILNAMNDLVKDGYDKKILNEILKENYNNLVKDYHKSIKTHSYDDLFNSYVTILHILYGYKKAKAK